MIGPTSCGKTDCQLPCQDCICIFCEGMFLLFGFLVVLTGKEGILPIFLVKFFKVWVRVVQEVEKAAENQIIEIIVGQQG
ncbi:hypothetical protein CY35_11G048600 [Sphagnum magellanicum]|nr:hypothetical protein CY35_11G048600 [Sphagnum magellanicum]